MSRHVIRGGLVIACFLHAQAAAGQDRPTVFIHGLASSGDTWAAAAARLRTAVAIDPYRPSTSAGGTRRYESQAEEVDQQVQQAFGTIPGTTIAIGHSNGGIVAREWSRTRPLGGIITVGTPHQGAPIVWNGLAYANFDLAMVDAISDMWSFFYYNGSGWEWVLADGIGDAIALAEALVNTSFVRAAFAIGLNLAGPVFPQMLPGSSYLMEQLNSIPNLEREQREIPSRVGIVSVAHNFDWGGPIRTAKPELGDRNARFRDAGIFALIVAATTIELNAAPGNITAHQIADYMYRAADFLNAMDPWWCGAISWPGMSQCWDNDTVLPVWTQDYSRLGGTRITVLDGPAHTQETQLSDQWLKDALTRLMHVPAR